MARTASSLVLVTPMLAGCSWNPQPTLHSRTPDVTYEQAGDLGRYYRYCKDVEYGWPRRDVVAYFWIDEGLWERFEKGEKRISGQIPENEMATARSVMDDQRDLPQ